MATTLKGMENEFGRLLADVKSLLKYHRDLGLESYPFAPPRFDRPAAERGPKVASPRPTPPQHGGLGEKAGRRADELRALASEAEACGRCGLAARRRLCVFGEGAVDADVLLLTEMPAASPAKALVIDGQERKLLAKMLAAIELTLGQVYLTALVKCGQETVRQPSDEEFAACRTLLMRQMEAVKPKIILVFGEKPAQLFLQSSETIFQLRGKAHRFNGLPLFVTYHPGQLLAENALKRFAWQDLLHLQKELQRLRH